MISTLFTSTEIRGWKPAVVLLLAVLLSGCMYDGGLFRNITEPFSTDFKNTPVGSKQCTIPAHRLREPFSGYGISAEWDTSTLTSAMRNAGMTNISYMDLRTRSFLFDIYMSKSIIVYGD